MCAMLHDMNDDDAGVVYCLDDKMCCDVVMVWGHTSVAGCKCRVLRHTTAAITAVGAIMCHDAVHTHTHTTQGTHCAHHRCCNAYDDVHTHTDTCTTCAVDGVAVVLVVVWLPYILVTYRSVLA